MLKGAQLAEKRPVPKHIQSSMKVWRSGFAPMPKEYIDFHKNIAMEVLNALTAEYGIRVVEVSLRDAGWFDGMKEVNAIVETKKGRLERLVYCDSNQGFMRKLSAGQGSFDPKEVLA